MSIYRNINTQPIVLASDHAGFKLKELIKKYLIKKRKKILDLGTKNINSVDYSDFAHLLAKKIKDKQFGILICGSGTGMSMAANRHKNIRAALCYNIKSTNQHSQPLPQPQTQAAKVNTKRRELKPQIPMEHDGGVLCICGVPSISINKYNEVEESIERHRFLSGGADGTCKLWEG